MKRQRDEDQKSLSKMDNEAPNQLSSSSSSSPHVLLSTSILFRHGARGPGKSEVAPWDKTNHVVSQWKENEFEQLSSVGLQQMNSLGAFYAHRCEKLNLKSPSLENCRFYSSKEKRAKHSGDEFVSSFLKTFNELDKKDDDDDGDNDSHNSILISKSIPDTPLPMDPDYYFRPWKIYADVDRVIKAKRDSVISTIDSSKLPLLAQSSSTLSLSSLSQQHLQLVASESADLTSSSLSSKPDKQWHDKVLEYEELLRRIGETLQMKQSIAIHPHLVLWSTTHIQCLLTCEKDWQQRQNQLQSPSLPLSSLSQLNQDISQCIHDDSNTRTALRQLISEELERPVLELACWVWEQRFTQSGFQVDLGGWMFLTLVQQTFDLSQSSNIVMYAGHDYTVLCMLSAAGVLSTLAAPLKFGCYVVFELWGDGNSCSATSSSTDNFNSSKQMQAGQHTLGLYESNRSNNINNNNSNDTCTRLKIVCNFQPFDYACNNNNNNNNDSNSVIHIPTSPPLPSVHAEREVVMAELSMTELRTRVESVCATLIAHGRGLPPGFSMPSILLQPSESRHAKDTDDKEDDTHVKHIDSNVARGSGSGGSGCGREGEVTTSVSVSDTYSKCTSFASNMSSIHKNNNNKINSNKSSSGVDIAQILARMDSDKSSAVTVTASGGTGLGTGAVMADVTPLTSHDESQSKPKSTCRRRQQTNVSDCCC